MLMSEMFAELKVDYVDATFTESDIDNYIEEKITATSPDKQDELRKNLDEIRKEIFETDTEHWLVKAA